MLPSNTLILHTLLFILSSPSGQPLSTLCSPSVQPLFILSSPSGHPISTLAGPPSQPMAPVVVVAMCTCMQVRWSKTNPNGSPITAFVLRGKAVDDDSYNDMYHGPLTAHLVMSLMPDVST